MIRGRTSTLLWRTIKNFFHLQTSIQLITARTNYTWWWHCWHCCTIEKLQLGSKSLKMVDTYIFANWVICFRNALWENPRSRLLDVTLLQGFLLYFYSWVNHGSASKRFSMNCEENDEQLKWFSGQLGHFSTCPRVLPVHSEHLLKMIALFVSSIRACSSERGC